MAKRKSSPQESVNTDADPTAADIAASTPTASDVASDPVLDTEQVVANALGLLAKCIADSNQRIVRRKVKVGGVWYYVEVSRP